MTKVDAGLAGNSPLSPARELSTRLQQAMSAAFGPQYGDVDPVLRSSQFADFQSNAALALAKQLGRSPRDVAAQIEAGLNVDGVCSKVEISGPGFINLSLDPEWIGQATTTMSADPRLGVPLARPATVVIDYSAPNVAKEMHVGHLRTTIVGDALARITEHLGFRVIRQNHIGDWGTPFGMLIEHLLELGEGSPGAEQLVKDPNLFYRTARSKFETDTQGPESFAARARARVVALQAGDPATSRHWSDLVARSTDYFNTVYDLLGVTLTDADLAGESTYNTELASICDELEAAGLATISDGALCVFLEGFTGREGKPVPLIVRKSDGGYGYATTDLATVRHRVRNLGADRILYVIGAPQSLHLQMVFATARAAGWLPEGVDVVHVQIGNVLGPDGKILKTRSGAPVKLQALLDEAVERATTVVDGADRDLAPQERATIARMVGIGAVKYADLHVAHDSSYTFDLDRMVSLNGNTGPYLQYAAARLRSILRRAGREAGSSQAPLIAGHEAERALMLALLGFGDVVSQSGRDCEPHRLCTYLFSLAQTLTTFYDQCPVLGADSASVREARLGLCDVTLRVLEQGLWLLGLDVPERM